LTSRRSPDPSTPDHHDNHKQPNPSDPLTSASIERIFVVFDRRAFDELDGVFHPDYVDHTPMGDLRGVPAFKEYLKTWLDALPDARFELSNVIVDGDLAAWQVRQTGTHTGPLMGIPPTGRSVEVLAVHMGRLSEDGRPLEHWTGNDMMALMQQLGLVPEMAGATAAA
jgi:predicted ester cyclase